MRVLFFVFGVVLLLSGSSTGHAEDTGDTGCEELTWFDDDDNDGHGDPSQTTTACEQPFGFVGNDDDCDDQRSTINPGATEICDGVDNDCDDAVDEPESSNARTWFADSDGDGHGDPSQTTPACTQPSGFVLNDDDCDDSDAAINPEADEVCDGADNDCDRSVDEGSAVDAVTWFDDDDSDGHGDSNDTRAACSQPAGYVAEGGDCNDRNAAIHPDAAETCDRVDNNCDGEIDEAGATGEKTWFADDDGDGFGNKDTTQQACSAPSGHTGDSSDCDDTDAQLHPNADDEPYDGIDQDCDGADLTDVDGDGFDGTEAGGDDCADTDRNIHPDAPEVFYDGIDQNCDNQNDFDQDGDGFDFLEAGGADCDDTDPLVNPGVDEVCEDGLQVDTDCDGDPNTDRDGVLNGPLTELFRDLDGDGQGAGDPIRVCGVSDGYERDALDCDDSDPTVYSGAEEICDGRDQNCDTRIDESTLEQPALGCVTFFEDTDDDGFGNPAAEACLCVEGSDAPRVGGISHVRSNADCNDNDSTIHPTSCKDEIDNDGDGLIDADDPECDGTHDEFGAIETHHERRNGHDDDCDGEVMAVELDCDADGHLAQVPADTGGALLDPLDAPISAAWLGLEACAAGESQPLRALTCWNTEVFLRCDESAGLWMYNYKTDVSGRFVQGQRVSMSGSDRVDCDDQCDGRSPSTAETCDGMDNDCSGAIVPGGDSLPAPMLPGVSVPGTLSTHEVDLDQDHALACDRFQEDGPQREVSGTSCGDKPTYTDEPDWNPTCALAAPGLPDACDGFATTSPDQREADADDDGFASCGTFSKGTTAFSVSNEHIYVPVWLAPLPAGSDLRTEALVPLLLPRMGGNKPRTCDAPLAAQLDALLAEDGLSVAELHSLPADEQARLLASACDNQGGACGIVELTWKQDTDADSYEELYSGDDTGTSASPLLLPGCEARPEEWISRSVWLQERILQARQTIEAAECLRLYGVPCAEVDERTVLQPGWEVMPSAEDHLAEQDAQWWMELGRFNPTSFTAGTLLTCDGDPTDERVSPLRVTGGDCDDESSLSHREMVEGDDLLGVFFGEEIDCSTCFDCIDNNCNGLADIEDPACVRCAIINPTRASQCDSGGCAHAGTRQTAWLPAVLLMLGLFGRRRNAPEHRQERL